METSVSSMDGSISSSPNAFFTQGVDELKQIILSTKLELESIRATAKAQSQSHKAKVEELEELLAAARRERDEAMQKYIELQSNVCSSSISSCSLATASFMADSPLDSSFNDQSDWLSFPAFDTGHNNGDDMLTHTGELAVNSFEEYCLEDHPGLNGVAQEGSVPLFPVSSNSCLQNGSALASILTPLPSSSSYENNDKLRKQVVRSSEAEADMSVMLRNLPERGKLLQAVMEAGPLLHSLLLAGPLPQWHHPPPGLDSFQVTVNPFGAASGSFSSSPLDFPQPSCLSDGDTKSHRKRQLALI